LLQTCDGFTLLSCMRRVGQTERKGFQSANPSPATAKYAAGSWRTLFTSSRSVSEFLFTPRQNTRVQFHRTNPHSATLERMMQLFAERPSAFSLLLRCVCLCVLRITSLRFCAPMENKGFFRLVPAVSVKDNVRYE